MVIRKRKERHECRRCGRWFGKAFLARTNDYKWICLKCKSHDEEIAKKVSK
jgi:Zn finger protein HypA/HybF involved in hydrogenase expression